MNPEYKRGMWVGFHVGLLVTLTILTALMVVSRYF